MMPDSDSFRPDAALLPLLPPHEHPDGCDCGRCERAQHDRLVPA